MRTSCPTTFLLHTSSIGYPLNQQGAVELATTGAFLFNNMKKITPLSKTYKKLGIAFTFPIAIKDKDGNRTYCELSNGFWSRYEYDNDGNETYFENSNGLWSRWEYDEKGDETYFHYCSRSNGSKWGTKRGTCSGKVIEIDGKKYELTEL